MKYFIAFELLIILIVLYILTYKPDMTKAIIQMDGLARWYRVSNYDIDKQKCINFTDGLGKKIHFCGAYKVIQVEEFYKK